MFVSHHHKSSNIFYIMSLNNQSIVFKLVGITHAGTYCLECGKNFPPENWREHFKRHHVTTTLPKKVSNIVQLLKYKITTTKSRDDPRIYAQSDRQYSKIKCLGCSNIYRDKFQIQNHFASKHNSCLTENGFVPVQCYQLKCGRYYPIPEAPLRQENQPASIPPTHQPPNPHPPMHYMQFFSSLPYNNTVHAKDVETILTQLIGQGDVTDQWIKIFHKFIATDDFFLENLEHHLGLAQLKPAIALNADTPLTRLMHLFVDLEAHVRSISDGVPANWKSQLVSFDVPREDNSELEGATTWTFRYRNNSSPQLREFGHLLCYLKHFQCPILQCYVDLIDTGDYCQQEAFRCGIIAKLIYELTVELVPNGDYIPWICRFTLFRCFMLDGGRPKLKGANQCGKIFATMLYIMREGALACASMMMNSGNSIHATSMIRCVQQSHVINIISPWISYCRAMTARQANAETSFLANNGDIICNNATFRREIYTQLIPLVRSSICRLFSLIFANEDWNLFVSNSNQIRVRIFVLSLLQVNSITLFLFIISFLSGRR